MVEVGGDGGSSRSSSRCSSSTCNGGRCRNFLDILHYISRQVIAAAAAAAAAAVATPAVFQLLKTVAETADACNAWWEA